MATQRILGSKLKPMLPPIRNKADKKTTIPNAEYFEMLNKSLQEIKEGKIVEVSAEEMRNILSE